MVQCFSEPPELASKWDLTAAVDLLRSPAHITPQHHSLDYECSIPSNWRRPTQDVTSASGLTPGMTSRRSHPNPKLGDFLPVLDVLNQDSEIDEESVLPATSPSSSYIDQHTPQPARVKTILKRDTQDPISPRSRMGGSHSAPFTTLQHAAHIDSSGRDTTISSPPRTLPIPIAGISHTSNMQTPAVNPKNTSRVKHTNPAQDALFSSSGTDADSDSTTIIFEHPARVTRKGKNALAFVPTQLGTANTRIDHHETPPSSLDDWDCILNDNTFPNILQTLKGTRALPATYKDSTERLVGLMTKLLHEFPEYAKLLSQVRRLSPTTKGRPVHVFVDMSNIIVGFKEAVKISRKIPITTRVPRLHMSFSNLSLIMERGRPATKRVLVGSDRLPSIDEAENLGYEANILDRVKVKSSASRPSKSRKGPGSQLASSGPEMAGVTGSRWVEQGVDEILHLKILESLLDTAVPATIVLATGDAAEAEYSGGFLRMVERALQRGWSVELVSFSRVTSKAYHRKEFREKWGHRFQVIDLDSYLEELFE